MKCPSCSSPLARDAERCDACKLTLRRLDLKFGAIPRVAAYVTDRTERLAAKDIERMRDDLRRFERRFPQIVPAVFVIDLPRGESISEYAFWIANRARLTSIEAIGGDNFVLLLVIDTLNGNAALTVGYGLEDVTNAADLDGVLRDAAEALRDDVLGGTRICFDKLDALFVERASNVKPEAVKEPGL